MVHERNVLCAFRDAYHPEEKYASAKRTESIVGRLVDSSLKVRPIAEINAEWERAAFETNPYPFPENAEYITKKGERVRSRAEYIITDCLYEMRIPYRYECVLEIGGRTFYPDFTIRHPETGELYYLEFFGMMDDPEYASNALKKIQFYTRSPLCGRFLYLFDSIAAPLNTVVIHNLLQRVFLDSRTD